MLEPVKKHWRVALLVVVVLASTVVLFAPQFAPETGVAADENPADARQGITNLQFGLDLAGGTRIRAPLEGYTATDVNFDGDDPPDVGRAVADGLSGTDSTDISVTRSTQREGYGTIEVTDANVTEEQFRTAVEAAGYWAEDTEVRVGVTEETRNAAQDVIQSKINEAGLSGGQVQQVTDPSGRHYMQIEVPGEGREDVIELLEDRGTVRLDIYYPDPDAEGNATRIRNALVRDDFDEIGTATRDQRSDVAYVPVTIVGDAPEGQQSPAEQYQAAVQEADAAAGRGQGTRWRCNTDDYTETEDPCLLLVVDDEVVSTFGMDDGLADSMRAGTWANDPNFRLTTGNEEGSFERAQEVSINLRAGALPAELNIGGEGSVSSISPTQGESFRLYSLITGIISVFAVAGMVFLRYREKEVALPMILTALAEVYALLGFAALVNYPIDLAVVAGFIAVVGTGVDDLIIIADEVMSEGDVNSRTVFDSRFRRAFWVIGAAAATTIIAMSPLMVLGLGDLSGFAIFTILGVLIGVLITRPAYGDILRTLLTER
ncbi:preprotein translocase subunit SecD [Haloparvum alkalitolerans]|uniref:preprotein translocase subunit SecD n=1 Tax=Haloparvum alkalitolerans TaxID=1042953 RepID=UPI003CECBED2